MKEDLIFLAVAASKIASILLLLGRTFHSCSKTPLKPTADSTLNIVRQNLDRSLRDLTNNPDQPFGGTVIVLAGDFRQVLPIIKNGSRAQIVGASI